MQKGEWKRGIMLSFFIIVLPSFLPLVANVGADLSDPSSLMRHSPVYITKNSEFNVTNGVVTGNGTAGNPYIMENLTIDASKSHGINIEFTTAHFVIRNCFIFDGDKNAAGHYGIYLNYARNAKIENCRLVNNRAAIYAEGSDDGTISNNTLYNNDDGIYLIDDSERYDIYNNTAYDNGNSINLRDGSDQNVIHDSVLYDNNMGLTISTAINNDIYNMTVYNNYDGINLWDANNNNFRNITTYNNGYGFNVTQDSADNIIESSKIFDNKEIGLRFYFSGSGNSILNCTIFNNKERGMVFDHSGSGNSVLNCTIFNNTDWGLSIAYGGGFNIHNNTVYNNANGVFMSSGNGRLYNNRVFNNTDSGMDLGSGGNDILYDNMLYNNTYNFVMQGGSSNNTIPTNNTVDGKPIYYWWQKKDSIVPSDAGVVVLAKCDNITVRDLTITKNGRGILLGGTVNSTIENNTLVNNRNGLELMDGSNKNTISNNVIFNNSRNGLYIGNSRYNTLYNNTLFNNTYNLGILSINSHEDEFHHSMAANNTVDGKKVYYWDGEADKTVPSDAGYVLLWNCTNITVANLTLTKNGQGIILIFTNESHIENNTVTRNVDGIHLLYSRNNTLNNNTIDWNYNGLILYGTVGIEVDNNTMNRNDYEGFFIYASDMTMVHNNQLNYNRYSGFYELFGTGITFFNNTFINNFRGIGLSGTDGIVIFNNILQDNREYGLSLDDSQAEVYNNYFRNTLNAKGGGNSIWNISKTAGKNIIGGSYLGGNFWLNYAGNDTNGDGLGDTDLPHWPGDELPLTMPRDRMIPGIRDDTPMVPSTGDVFKFEAYAWDNWSLGEVYTEYWFDGGTHTNSTMTKDSGDYDDGNFSKYVTVPSNAYVLHYNMSVRDIFYNWNSTGVKHLNIVDNDDPTVADLTKVAPTTGENITFNATAIDNINVSLVNITYWFNNGTSSNISLNLFGGTYSGNITVDDNATVLHYILSASDNSSNWVFLPQENIVVIDNDRPKMVDLSNTPSTGDVFRISANITDNVAMEEARAEYWFDLQNHINVSMTRNVTYESDIQVPTDAKYLYYIISANDTSDNLAVLPQVGREVMDNDVPVVKDLTVPSPLTGQRFKIAANVTDNKILTSVGVVYWFDNGTNQTSVMTKAGDFEYTVDVPPGARVLNYIIRAFDGTNKGEVQNVLNVSDVIKPTFVDKTTTPTTGDELAVLLDVRDNWNVSDVWVEYWFDGGNHANVTYAPGLVVGVPDSSVQMHYIVTATDSSGNIGVFIITRDVVDNDAPAIVDLNGVPLTGEKFAFQFALTDNILVDHANLLYWFDGAEITNVTYEENLTVVVPNNALFLHYKLIVLDTAGNEAELTGSQRVKDIILPVVTDRSGIPETGGEFEVVADANDNIGLMEVRLRYTFDGGETFETDMTSVEGVYVSNVSVPMAARALKYTITALDHEGNLVFVNRSLDVRDVVLPEIEDRTGTPTTGDDLPILVLVRDNIGISETFVEYWFNAGTHKKESLTSNMKVTVPAWAKSLSYTVSARDIAGNENTTMVQKTIMDNDSPNITDRTSGIPMAMGEFRINASVVDNIGVLKVTIEYWFDGEHRAVKAELANGVYYADIVIENKEELHYRIATTDLSGNSILTEDKVLSITPAITPAKKTDGGDGNLQIVMWGIVGLIVAILAVLMVLFLRKRRKASKKGN